MKELIKYFDNTLRLKLDGHTNKNSNIEDVYMIDDNMPLVENMISIYDNISKISTLENDSKKLKESIKLVLNQNLTDIYYLLPVFILSELNNSNAKDFFDVEKYLERVEINKQNVLKAYIHLMIMDSSLVNDNINNLMNKKLNEYEEKLLINLQYVSFHYLNNDSYKSLDINYDKNSKEFFNIFKNISIYFFQKNDLYKKLITKYENIKNINKLNLDNTDILLDTKKDLIADNIDTFFDFDAMRIINGFNDTTSYNNYSADVSDKNILFYLLKNKNQDIEDLFNSKDLNINIIYNYINTMLEHNNNINKKLENVIEKKFKQNIEEKYSDYKDDEEIQNSINDFSDINNFLLKFILKNNNYNNFVTQILLISDENKVNKIFEENPLLTECININSLVSSLSLEETSFYQKKLAKVIDSSNNILLCEALNQNFSQIFTNENQFLSVDQLDRFNITYSKLSKKERTDFNNYVADNIYSVNISKLYNGDQIIKLNFDEIKYFMSFYKEKISLHDDFNDYNPSNILQNLNDDEFNSKFKIALGYIHNSFPLLKDLDKESFIEKEMLKIATTSKTLKDSPKKVFKV